MRSKFFFLLAGLILATDAARAQPSLQFSLSPGVEVGVNSNSITFAGTLVNSEPTNLYLNNLVFDFIGAATNDFGPGSNTFFMNVPGILRPGETYNDVVFSVTANPAASPGDYFGTVTIQGGTNIFALTNLATQIFLITSTDTVGDGIPDWWRQTYFGGDGATTNAQSCATCDADATGQNNLFKYVAGLDPTNPASVFVLSMAQSKGTPPQPILSFGPAIAGRTYTVQTTTNLRAGGWSSQSAPLAFLTNSNQVTIAIQSQGFYRVEVEIP